MDDQLSLTVCFGRSERRQFRAGDALEVWTRHGDRLGELPAAMVERFLAARLIDEAVAGELARQLCAAAVSREPGALLPHPLAIAGNAPASRSARAGLRRRRKARSQARQGR